MPIKGATYRTIQTSKGPVRLAYVKGQVVEAKNLKTNQVHTPAEFAADRRAAKRKGGK